LKTVGVEPVEVVDKSCAESDSRVVRITTGCKGGSFFLKRFATVRKYNQAAYAYQNWLVAVDAVVPRLVAVRSEERLLLLTDIGDCSCGWRELSLSQKSSLLTQAGKFLRSLHETPCVNDDSMSVGDAILGRAAALQRKIEGGSSRYLSDGQMSSIVKSIEEVRLRLNQIKRVPCHRDFWRRNWIWTAASNQSQGNLRLGVIDFEHARYDLFLLDLMKVWSDCWLTNSQLEEAFWQGYGRRLTNVENALLKVCAKVHAAQTIVWAEAHQQAAFLDQGLRLLAATDHV
jgi:aminoglycoside/choline kinase family phosphotransferase